MNIFIKYFSTFLKQKFHLLVFMFHK